MSSERVLTSRELGGQVGQHQEADVRLAVTIPVLLTFGMACLPQAASAAERAACTEAARRVETQAGQLNALEINNLLFAAAENDCEALAVKLLDNGASLEARDREGNRALARAARAGRAAMVQMFLARGAEIDARNIIGSTALYLAAEKDRAQAIDVLLKAGANINLPGRSGARPLAAAAFNGAEAAVTGLLANGAEVAAADITGKTALAYSAAAGWPGIVEKLLSAGADINQRQGNDTTVLAWAAGHPDNVGEEQALEVVRLLLARGARLEDADDRGRTALMAAAEAGHGEIALALMAAGALRGTQDRAGKRAADLAVSTELRARLEP